MVWLELKTILWKNYTIRKHHLLLTLLEIALPGIAIYFYASVMSSETRGANWEQLVEPKYFEIMDSSKLVFTGSQEGARLTVCYTPENQFTSKLMKKFQSKLEAIKNLEITVIPYKDEKEVNDCFLVRHIAVAVIFRSSESDTNLRYIITPRHPWPVKNLYDENGYSSLASRYLYSFVACVQMATETSYTEIISEKDLPVQIYVQKFPQLPMSGKLEQKFYGIAVSIALLLVFSLLCTSVLRCTVEEKSTGFKELMKMKGMESWMLWLGWFIYAFVSHIFSLAITTHILYKRIGDHTLIDHSDRTVVYLFLLLYCAASITFGFALSVFFYKPTTAVAFGVLAWFAVFIVPVYFSPGAKLSTQFLSMLSPNMALYYGLNAIDVYENMRIGVKWKYFYGASGEYAAMEYVLLMLLVDIILYSLIIFYFENIFPGPFGIAKPFDFPITYLRNKCMKRNVIEIEEEAIPNLDCKIEPVTNLKPSIRIKDLYKRYGKYYVAVNGLSIDIYDEQITALLGHNGAGKTTTMSIITGMLPATSGKILINGVDMEEHIDEIRNLFGLCPQHNLYSNDLTVIEHLMLFGMLRKLSYKQAKEEAELLLTKMNIYNKRNDQAATLSGGMQRKLCLGMALMGDPKILVLDEPTSGLDPESRRELWDMLLTYRGSHTIILTTHFMEEADILGDRIAIMDHGQLVCYGTSMFLKNEYGTGYSLILHTRTQLNTNEVQAITSLVRGKITTAVLESRSGSNLKYFLPRDQRPRFAELLGELENKKGDLKIINISLSLISLEEVFLRVGEIKANKVGVSADAAQAAASNDNPPPKFTGLKLFGLQLWSLLKKRWYYFRRKWEIFVISMGALLFITAFVLFITKPATGDQSHDTFTYKLGNYRKSEVFYKSVGSNPVLDKIKEKYINIVKKEGGNPQEVTTSVSDVIIKEGPKDPLVYVYSWIIAAEFNASANNIAVNAMYSGFALHSFPISLNLMMNAILKSLKGDAYSISGAVTDPRRVNSNQDKTFDLIWGITATFSFGMVLLPLMFLFFPHHERASNVKQLQLMCGVSSASYWFINYIFDYVLFFICAVAVILLMLLYGLSGFNMLIGKNQLAALFVVMLTYGLNALPYTYLFTYKKTIGGAFTLLLTSNIFLLIVCLVYIPTHEMLQKPEDIKASLNRLYYLSHISPFGITYTVYKYMYKAVYNYKLSQPNVDEQLIPESCREGLNTPKCIDFRRYFGNDESSLYGNVLIMVQSFVITTTILLLLEWQPVYEILEWIRILLRKRQVEPEEREDIQAEAKRIYDKLEQEKSENRTVTEQDELLLVYNLQKIYNRRRIVKNVSFAVQPGECFGLLGVNGAGKSTTFRMLTGDLPVIKGKARILRLDNNKRIYLPRQSKMFLKNVGYCPQYDAINEVLTGRQMLQIFAGLRGMSAAAKDEVNKWITILGLEEYADKACGNYSGGNKRKLCTAIALIVEPTLIMLDEPTSGVDPVSRRKLWEVINALQKQKARQSIILTSHGMDECEALCERLAIMKAGRVEFSGSIPNLKIRYGQGFTIALKVKSGSEGKAGEDPADIKNLITTFEQKYKGFCSLKDKHAGMLTYHISDTNKKLSQLFKEIEELKSSNKVIEDYSVNETTLEEIFLSIARAE